MTGFQPLVVLQTKSNKDAERTVSATQTVSERSLRRAETSEAISRTAGGGKAEIIVERERSGETWPLRQRIVLCDKFKFRTREAVAEEKSYSNSRNDGRERGKPE